jgi:superfamily II DNA or RNA helicase
LEAATGFGKSLTAIKLVNWIAGSTYKSRKPKMLLLVAKTVHKQTWRDEFKKWGGINSDVIMECYESLHKHCNEYFDIVLMDECHHVASEARQKMLKTLKYGYMIGLSATIPQKLKMWFQYNYHSQIVSCDIIEAIDSGVLPEPTILLFPLQVENTRVSETIEINPKAKGPVYHGEYKDLWKCKKQKTHAILKCTQRQKLNEMDKLIEWYKKKAMVNPAMKQTWLYFCGKRLEFLADCKLQWVRMILQHLDKERTITFCKTILQT